MFFGGFVRLMRVFACFAGLVIILITFGCDKVSAGQELFKVESRSSRTDLRTVDVQLSEYLIDLPEQLPSGNLTFLVKNAGNENHNFEIIGRGVDQQLLKDLIPNETGTLKLNLPSGDYVVLCPVDDHKGRGMHRVIRVGQSD